VSDGDDRDDRESGGSLITVDAPTDGVVVLTLERAERKNALSIALRDEMSDALDRLATDDATRVVLVTGAGNVFSAGFDLEEFTVPALSDELWASSDRWHRTLLEFPLPLVAAVNGAAYGGGFDLAVMCDVRVGAASARFAHPEHSFAQVVYGPLHDLVGGGVARDLALTGRRVDAAEAQTLGLVSRVVPDDELLDAARAVAAEIALAPREVLLAMVAKIRRRTGITPGATLDL
jgi:enoyl-CoA hydratase/carnithine racemase